MVQQSYIRCQNYYLMTSLYVPDRYKKAIILLQGYSHSMTDIDYFMSNIKTDLIEHEAIVLQFDPFGHGDSDGDFHEFNIMTLKNNLQAVVQWLNKQYDVEVALFTRGLYELIMRDADLSRCFSKTIALNPVILTPEDLYRLKKYISTEQKIQDFTNWFNKIDNENKEWFEKFFYICGAKLKNLRGQLINLSTLNRIVLQLNERTVLQENMLFILSNSNKYIVVSKIPAEYSISWFEKYGALPRDPDWHYRTIKKISELFFDNQ